nr:MAG TPA: hypothetical protein [Caudoviricetes sp.]
MVIHTAFPVKRYEELQHRGHIQSTLYLSLLCLSHL